MPVAKYYRHYRKMYFEDLSPYYYLSRHGDCEPDKNVLNIGWLEEGHPFPKGFVPERTLCRILALCVNDPVNRTMGFHVSPFLKPVLYGYSVEYDGRKTILGTAEIRVPGKDNRIYAAPDLVYHYMKDCGYLPPEEFLDAVDSLPPVENPSDEEYEIYSIALSQFEPEKGESIVFRQQSTAASLIPSEEDKPHIDNDEPWIDSELMHKNFMGGARRKRLLIGGDSEKMIAKEFPHIGRDTLEGFIQRNQTPAILKPRLRLDVIQELLPREYERLFWGMTSMENGWLMFKRAHPKATRYFSLSRVGFNASRTEALVEVGVWDASLSGRGVLMSVIKDADATWAVRKESIVWIS